MWGKRDRDNLESIAKSLEKLVEREQERELANNDLGLFGNTKQFFLSKGNVKLTDGLNPNFIEDKALEEELKLTERMQAKASNAKKDGNVPFWAEDLFDEKELEVLEQD